MDPAAILWAMGAAAEDAGEAFCRMMDWFGARVTEHDAALAQIAAQFRGQTYDAPQVLDRLLWVASAGRQ